LKAGGNFLKGSSDRWVVSCEPHCAYDAEEEEHKKETFFHPAKAVNKGKGWKVVVGCFTREVPALMSKPCCGERDRENMMKGPEKGMALGGAARNGLK
jgi:hypothetical protein